MLNPKSPQTRGFSLCSGLVQRTMQGVLAFSLENEFEKGVGAESLDVFVLSLSLYIYM